MNDKLRDFGTFCRAIALSKGELLAARNIILRLHGEHETAAIGASEIIRAAIGVGGVDWAGSLDDPSFIGPVSAFLNSLSTVGAFDRVKQDAISVPPAVRFVVATSGLTAATHSQGQARGISKLNLSAGNQSFREVSCNVVLSTEAMRFPSAAASDFVMRELQRAVAIETDNRFLSDITAGAATISASGIDSRSVLRDLGAALATMTTSAASKLYIICGPVLAKSLAFQFTSTGENAFEDLSPVGGTISGIPVVVSDAAPAQEMVVVDAAQMVVSDVGFEVTESRETSLQMDDAPDSPMLATTTMTSMFQENLVAIRAQRYFSAKMIGSAGVVVLNSAAYGDSPAP